MDAKIEQEPPEEKQEPPKEKQEKPIKKTSLTWSPERREKQRIAMIRLQAAGKGYKRNAKADNENEIIKSPISTTAPTGHSVSYYMTMSFIFILAVASIIIFFVKTGSLKQEAEN